MAKLGQTTIAQQSRKECTNSKSSVGVRARVRSHMHVTGSVTRVRCRPPVGSLDFAESLQGLATAGAECVQGAIL